MDRAIKIADNTHWVGVNDRETDLFEGLWPLPNGVAYNSYVIADEKVAVIDTVKHQNCDDFLKKISTLVGGKKIDYLIVNHMEPDHSGSIAHLVESNPEIKIIGNAKTRDFLKAFYNITENFIAMNDGELLDLGRHKLSFHLIPMVHWPETMVTYDATTKVLFSGDAFGGFGALEAGIFDDEIDLRDIEDDILRYYSNIVGKYSPMVQKAIAKLAGIDIATIAPTHGPVWRSNPKEIVGRYDRWSRYQGEKGVLIAYGSMYGNTERMMEAVARGVNDVGVDAVKVFDVSRTHVSFLLRDIWRYKGVVLGAPAYDTKLYPAMKQFVDLVEHKGLKDRVAGIFGSCGWSGGGVSNLLEFVKRMGWQLCEPSIEARCSPTDADLDRCVDLGRSVARSVMG